LQNRKYVYRKKAWGSKCHGHDILTPLPYQYFMNQIGVAWNFDSWNIEPPSIFHFKYKDKI